jgi:hypothetical protein
MVYAVKKMVNGYRNSGFQLVLFNKRPFIHAYSTVSVFIITLLQQ